MTRTRRPAAELMDAPDVDPAELDRALGDLRLVNRVFGGGHAAVAAAMAALGDTTRTQGIVTVLDLCTGSADIPLALLRRARRSGIDLRIVATDLHPGAVSAARTRTADEPAIRVEAADALDLSYPPRAFDLVMCHTALHHFDDDEAGRLLAGMGRVAARSVVVTDLARGRLALAAVRLLAGTLWRGHPVTRHDSVVSVRAAFTPEEALTLARAAGLVRPRLRRHPLFRFSLVAGAATGAAP